MKIKSDYKLQTSTSRQSTSAVQTVLLSTENGACDGVNINWLLHGVFRDDFLFRGDKPIMVIK
jgi:hypothetical protein